jgi:hypothetical protein
MILNRNSRDITYTPDGDFMISAEGNLNVSGMEHYQLLVEAIQKRLSADLGDWRSGLIVPSNIGGIIGLEVTNTNAGVIRAQILRTLTQYDLVDQETIFLSPPVLDGSKIIFTLSIRIKNSNEIAGMYFTYDTRENSFQAKTIARN